MLRIITLFIFLTAAGTAFAQSPSDADMVKRACMDYLDGFYRGDTAKIIRSLKPSLHKLGYWKNDSTGQYALDGYMTFEQAKAYAKRVFDRKRFAKDDAPREVEVLDVMHTIAAAKVTAWWGVDYLLLSKQDGHWMIEQVLWEGPLENQPE